MGDFILVVVPLGAPLAPHPILEHKKCAQSVPKSALREQKLLQKGSQELSKRPNVIPKGTPGYEH